MDLEAYESPITTALMGEVHGLSSFGTDSLFSLSSEHTSLKISSRSMYTSPNDILVDYVCIFSV